MRIAQVAPLYESVPPRNYGGTERVVSYLTEELVRQGHEVTLFASGDSSTSARLVAACPRALRTASDCRDPLARHLVLLELVLQQAALFDIIHFHIDPLHYSAMRRHVVPHVTTLHGRLDLPDLQPLYREFADLPLVAISNSQRGQLPWLRWLATIHHGLPGKRFTFHPTPGDHLAFVGRVSPEKGLDLAVEIARRAGMPLRVAAKVDRSDREYFQRVLRPLLTEPEVAFLGEIGDREKDDVLGRARALLFPVDWPEPFGLAMIEAMACGTPVIAFDRGAVAEILADGISGFVVRDVDEAVRAVGRVDRISRARCRTYFEARFSVERMTREYVSVYQRLLAAAPREPLERRPPDGRSTEAAPGGA